MHPFIRIRATTLLVLTTFSGLSLTAHAAEVEISSNSLLADRTTNLSVSPTYPFSHISDLVTNSALYESITNSEDFLKVQDMAKRIWANQTGKKRQVHQRMGDS